MDPGQFIKSIDRRTFMRIVSLTGIAGLVYPRKLISGLVKLPTSRIVIVQDDWATNGNSIDGDVVQIMMDSAIKALAQIDDVGEAWKSFFSNITTSSVIAIKVNCRYTPTPTHPEVTYAVAEGLKMMPFGGTYFPENNIIIYDKEASFFTQSGYTVNTSGEGIRCFDNGYAGYSSETYDVNGSNQRISRVLTDMADYLVNISVLKNHAYVSGVTLCLKNHLGTCHNPIALHPNYADPYIPALNALPVINGIQCVNIIDALFGVRSGGPEGYPQFAANKIILSEDIVATDYMGRELLEENGCTTTYMATHIDTAATQYGLGTNDPEQMDVIDIYNPSTGIDDSNGGNSLPNKFQLLQNYPNPFNSQTQIRFYLPGSSETSVQVINIQGQRVRQLINKRLGKGWHQISWDSKNEMGKAASSGIYLCQVRTKDITKSIIMELIK